jgi:amino acid transporter
VSGRGRWLFLAAAVLALASLALPLWGFRMSAAQYAGDALHLRVGRNAISGDVQEITTLQKYIGVRLPTTFPEMTWLTPAIASIALLLALAGVLASSRGGRALGWAATAALLLFLAGSGLVLQKRLYDIGHHRDPRAPIRAIRDFTPIVVGPARVGNFTVWSYPHAGGLALAAAAVLAIWGTRRAGGRDCACESRHGSAAPRGAVA